MDSLTELGGWIKIFIQWKRIFDSLRLACNFGKFKVYGKLLKIISPENFKVVIGKPINFNLYC